MGVAVHRMPGYGRCFGLRRTMVVTTMPGRQGIALRLFDGIRRRLFYRISFVVMPVIVLPECGFARKCSNK